MRTRVYLQKELNERLSSLSTAVSYMGGTANVVTGTTDEKFTKVVNGIKALKPKITQSSDNNRIISAKCGNGPASTLTLPIGDATVSSEWKKNLLEITLTKSTGWVDGATNKLVATLSYVHGSSVSTNIDTSHRKKLFTAGDRVYFPSDYFIEAAPAGTQGGIVGVWNRNKLSVSQRNTAGYLPTNCVSATVEIDNDTAGTIVPSTSVTLAKKAGSRVYYSNDLKVGTLGGNCQAADVRAGRTFSSDMYGRNLPGTLYLPAHNSVVRIIDKPFQAIGNPRLLVGGIFNIQQHAPLERRPNLLIVEYKLKGTASENIYEGATTIIKGKPQPICFAFPDSICAYTETAFEIYGGRNPILEWVQISAWDGDWYMTW